MRSLLHAFILVAFSFPAQSVSIMSDQDELIDHFMVLDAPKVRVIPTKDPTVSEIRISPVARNYVAISPEPHSTNIRPEGLNQQRWNSLFEKEPIPALLTWAEPHKAEEGIHLNLTLKRLNSKTGQFVFLATLRDSASQTLAHKAHHVKEAFVYGTLRNAALTLDDEHTRVIRSASCGANPMAENSQETSRAQSCSVSPEQVTTTDVDTNACAIHAYTNCSGMSLIGADLSRQDLYQSTLDGVDLTDANLYMTIFRYSHLGDAKLVRADLRYAYLEFANLDGADLTDSNAIDGNFWRASLRNSTLSYANLGGAELYEADLSGAKLNGANLQSANLAGANLSHADLTNADLTNASLAGASLTGAIGCYTVKPKRPSGC